MKARPPAMPQNGRSGSPGITPRTAMKPDVTNRASGLPRSWLCVSAERLPSPEARLTMRPAAVEMRSAGIWLTRPSPMESSVNVCAASAGPIPCCATPMMSPPTMLMPVMTRPAMASPRTNFEAPSMAP